MTLHLRPGVAADAPVLGDICYRAFVAIAAAHGFPPDFPSAEFAAGVMDWQLQQAGIFNVVAELNGRIVGSNFLDERNPIGGVGPVTVDPDVQNAGVGRALMDAVLRRSDERRSAGVRLIQAGYHTRSLALYAKLGFEVRESLACMQGPAIGATIAGYPVRMATARDLASCNQLCLRVHGHVRDGELARTVERGAARVVERDGRITGYATGISFFAHAVGETTGDLEALIAEAAAFPGAGFLVPMRNGALLRWCLDAGLRIVQPMTLMTRGAYQEAAGAWMPSVMF